MFELKKLITFFVEPLGLILTLTVLGLWFLFTHKPIRAKIFLAVSTLLLLGFSQSFVANYLVNPLENKYPVFNPAQHPNTQFVHILGFGHNQDTRLPLASRFYDTSLKRIVDGVFIFRQLTHPDKKLILTGYKPDSFQVSVAAMAKKLAVELGVNPDNIILGEMAKDTQDEAKFSQKIVGDKALVLVSSASHLPRAVRLFSAKNINAIAAPVNFLGAKNSGISKPRISSLMISQTAVHEYYGKWWLDFKDYFLFFLK